MSYFIEESGKRNYLDGQAYAFNQLGTKYRNTSQYQKSISMHQKGLDAATKAENIEFRIFSLNMLGVVYRRMDAIKTALDYSQEALELAETIENPSEGIKRSINVSHNSIGNIYQTLRQYDMAIEQFRRSMQLEKELGNKRGLAVNHQNIGECLEEQGKLEEALENFRTALAYDEEIGSDRGKAICKNSIAQIYIEQGKLNEALNILQPTLVSAEAGGDMQITSSVLINLGWAFMKLKQSKQAEDYLQKGLSMAKKHNLPKNISLSYGFLSELSDQTGDSKAALEYFKKSEEFDDMVTNDLNLSYVNDVIIRYDTEKKNNQQ